jgi:uncharacterized membrane protein YkvA (DUF1232 family)
MADRPDDEHLDREHLDSETMTGVSSEDEEALERRSEEALVTELADLPSSGLLSFYDRLRERILERIDRRGGKMADATVRALLLVPDVFILLVRLAMDKEVPASARMMIGGALAYFVLPMDLMPEALLGAGGFLDDLVLATAVLAQAFSGELEPYARRHWSGSEDLRVVIQDIAYTAENLLGAKLYGRLEHLLARRGIRLPEGSSPPPRA